MAAGSHLIGLAGEGATANSTLVSWSGSSFATAVAVSLWARNESPVQVPTNGKDVSWWLDQPVDYAGVPGLVYMSATGGMVTAPTTP